LRFKTQMASFGSRVCQCRTRETRLTSSLTCLVNSSFYCLTCVCARALGVVPRTMWQDGRKAGRQEGKTRSGPTRCEGQTTREARQSKTAGSTGFGTCPIGQPPGRAGSRSRNASASRRIDDRHVSVFPSPISSASAPPRADSRTAADPAALLSRSAQATGSNSNAGSPAHSHTLGSRSTPKDPVPTSQATRRIQSRDCSWKDRSGLRRSPALSSSVASSSLAPPNAGLAGPGTTAEQKRRKCCGARPPGPRDRSSGRWGCSF
jgi:hypothetical protein